MIILSVQFVAIPQFSIIRHVKCTFMQGYNRFDEAMVHVLQDKPKSALDAAATKIQAHYRGHIVRKVIVVILCQCLFFGVYANCNLSSFLIRR